MAAKKNNVNGLAEHRRQEVQQAVRMPVISSTVTALPSRHVEQLRGSFS
jgi:hypothetical protein